MVFKNIMIIKRFFNVNSYEKIIFKINFTYYYEKFRAFLRFYMKTSALDPQHCFI
jgi:hypothetical protein